MQIDNNTAVRAINKIYDIIKGIKFIGEELAIFSDIRKIENQFDGFNYARAKKVLFDLEEKYWKKLDVLGYYKFTTKLDKSPAEILKGNLYRLGNWLIRLIALKACGEVAKTSFEKVLKGLVEEYDGSKGLEIFERVKLLNNMIDGFDEKLLDKLQTSIFENN